MSIARDSAEKSKPPFRQTAAALFAIMSGRRKLQLYVAFILMLAGAVAELVTIGAVLPLLALAADPQYFSRFPVAASVLEFLGARPGDNLVVPAALILMAAAVAAALIRLSLIWTTQKLVFGLEHDISTRVFGRIIRQPYDAYVSQNSSAALAAVEKIYLVAAGVISPVISGVTSAGIAICIIIFLFMIDPVTAAVASVAMGILYVGMSIVFRDILSRNSAKAAVVRTQRIKLIQESWGGFRDIVIDQSQKVFGKRFDELTNEVRRVQITANLIVETPRFVVEGIGIVLIGALAIYFSLQPGGVLAAIPILGALAIGAQRLLPLVQAMYRGWTHYSVHAHILGDVLALMQLPVSTVQSHDKNRESGAFGGDIELRDVSFNYGVGEPALRNIDLRIGKGERVGLIGTTGSGKSTLVDLLMGLLRPTTGQMLLGGKLVDDSNIGDLQAHIAHVPQSIFLSDDTFAANIAFGIPEEEVDLARVLQAAERADIRAFIEQLPDGFMTKVGERGVRLSGGQRQRIGIARALYKKATILVLDEATSALDDKTEAAVMESVTGLGRDLTMILIAHRLSTASACDTIYRLDGGRIVQKGTYEEVVLGKQAQHSTLTP